VVNGNGRVAHDTPLGVLVLSAANGSVPAFEEIYGTLAPAVASYLRWHGVSDVEGVTNEVFAQVHRKLGGFTGDGTGFRSWVFTIAHHRMIDERRRAARRPRLDFDGSIEEASVTGDAELDAIAALSGDRVNELLTMLSPDQRDVVLLRVIADLSIEDVATALGKRQGAIKALQHRALATLRRQLEQEQVDR
jgi:RNA polymerase sigma-70 factor (ECF subfamily)